MDSSSKEKVRENSEKLLESQYFWTHGNKNETHFFNLTDE